MKQLVMPGGKKYCPAGCMIAISPEGGGVVIAGHVLNQTILTVIN
jgi:hypothetical protein